MGRLAQVPQQIAQALAAQIAAQRGQLLCWVPVCLALGIGLYFGLRFEPSVGVYAGALGAALVCAVASRFVTDAVGPLALALALCLIGFLLAGARAFRCGTRPRLALLWTR